MNRTSIAKALSGFALGLAVASCIVQQQPDPAGPATDTGTAEAEGTRDHRSAGQQAVAGTNLPDGAYACTIDKYQPFPCRVTTQADGSRRLEKLGGSQRFSGVVTMTENGFQFRGTYYCPYGSCTEAVTGDFTAYDDGLYRGSLMTQGNPTTVTIQYTQYAGYGGGVYGGGMYGAMLYGGTLYGAAGY